MKKSLLKEYFLVTPNEKITEKVFLTRMILSIASIVICVISVAYCAVAYFSHENTQMTVAIEKFDISVTPPQSCKELAPNTFRINNETDAAATYEFLLSRSSQNVTLGYCRVSVADNAGNINNYYTQPLGSFLKDGQAVAMDSRTVFVTVEAQTSVSVNFTAQNGSCALSTIDDAILIK